MTPANTILHNIKTFVMEIGTLIRRLRDKKKLSSREIAGKITVAQSTYTDWEHDKTSPSLKTYIRLGSQAQPGTKMFVAFPYGHVRTYLRNKFKCQFINARYLC